MDSFDYNGNILQQTTSQSQKQTASKSSITNVTKTKEDARSILQKNLGIILQNINQIKYAKKL